MASRKRIQRPKKPSNMLGFLLIAVLVTFVLFVLCEVQGGILWFSYKSSDLEKSQWVVLIGVIAAVAGWITSAWVTMRNSVKQHTINTLLQSRLSATYMENAKLVNGRYFTTDGIYRLTPDEIVANAPESALPALHYVLNYLEFIAVAVRYGDLDEALMRRTLRGMLCNVYEAAEALIRQRRLIVDPITGTETESKTFEHLQWLYGLWFDKNLRRPFLARPAPVGQAQALTNDPVPHGGQVPLPPLPPAPPLPPLPPLPPVPTAANQQQQNSPGRTAEELAASSLKEAGAPQAPKSCPDGS